MHQILNVIVQNQYLLVMSFMHTVYINVSEVVTIFVGCFVLTSLSLCRFKVDLTPFPTINRVTAALKELRAFQVSAPAEQPDCPPDLKN